MDVCEKYTWSQSNRVRSTKEPVERPLIDASLQTLRQEYENAQAFCTAITDICWCASWENTPARGCSGYEHRPGLRHQRGTVPSGSRAGHTPRTPARMHIWGSNGYIRMRIHNHTHFRIRISTPAVWYTVANVGMGMHVSVHTLWSSLNAPHIGR